MNLLSKLLSSTSAEKWNIILNLMMNKTDSSNHDVIALFRDLSTCLFDWLIDWVR